MNAREREAFNAGVGAASSLVAEIGARLSIPARSDLQKNLGAMFGQLSVELRGLLLDEKGAPMDASPEIMPPEAGA